MASHALVTVIIPSYNHAQYIRTAINSVLTQTYENIELIVVDDGSRDDSHTVISEFSDHPKVTTILNARNQGQSAVMNQALGVSRGKYISLLPSDDWFLPDKTAIQVAKMEASGCDVGVVYAAGARYFEDTGETVKVNLPVYTGWIARNLIETGNFIYPVTPLYRREVFDLVRPSNKFKAEGEAIHMRIALHYRYEYVDRVVAVMRDHSYNIGKNAEVMLEEVIKYQEWFFSLTELSPEIRTLKRASLGRLYKVKGMQLIFDQQERRKGRQALLKAVLLRPLFFLKHPKVIAALAVSFFPQSFINIVHRTWKRRL